MPSLGKQSANKHLIGCADHQGMSGWSGWTPAYREVGELKQSLNHRRHKGKGKFHGGEIITRGTPAQNSAGNPSRCTPVFQVQHPAVFTLRVPYLDFCCAILLKCLSLCFFGRTQGGPAQVPHSIYQPSPPHLTPVSFSSDIYKP